MSHEDFVRVRRALKNIAQKTGEWAGIPMPIEDHPLVIEPSYPFATVLSKLVKTEDPTNFKVRGSFWSSHRRSEVIIFQDRSKATPERPEGPIECGLLPGMHHLQHDLKTLGASVAWRLGGEIRALELLKSHLSEHAFERYLLTGMFLERAKRSGLYYLFRRLKPTVVITADCSRILACLCMHPIAYYDGSWAGALCPTDDVIAHLMLMRAAEKDLWRRSNQHPAYRPEAGL